MIDMAGKQLVPAVINYTTDLASSMGTVLDVCPDADVSAQKELLMESSALLSEGQKALKALREITAKAAAMSEGEAQARAYHDEVMPAMSAPPCSL